MAQRAVHGLYIQHNILLLSMGSRSRHLAHIIHLIIAVDAVVLIVYIYIIHILYRFTHITHTKDKRIVRRNTRAHRKFSRPTIAGYELLHRYSR